MIRVMNDDEKQGLVRHNQNEGKEKGLVYIELVRQTRLVHTMIIYVVSDYI